MKISTLLNKPLEEGFCAPKPAFLAKKAGFFVLASVFAARVRRDRDNGPARGCEHRCCCE